MAHGGAIIETEQWIRKMTRHSNMITKRCDVDVASVLEVCKLRSELKIG
jgi:hypothetical protein